MVLEKTGRVVWHDLFTKDVSVSRSFYERVAGWTYVVEQAKDFAWGGGERDFVLAISDGEAGAGFVELSCSQIDGWISYVEVSDVDLTADRAIGLGGRVEKPPFDVPGVGRNCLLRDPSGGWIGISLSRHKFPIPTNQFGLDIYLAPAGGFPVAFYRGLFDWEFQQETRSNGTFTKIISGGSQVGFQFSSNAAANRKPSWLPSIRVESLSEALCQLRNNDGGILDQVMDAPDGHPEALVSDKNGTLFYLTGKLCH